jgi:DNA helicase-2/ATP-dependent DNA helicase PcrA
LALPLVASGGSRVRLARRNIPFRKYGGLKFLEAAHVKDVISVLRWCENCRDRVAGFRVLQLLPGIGPSTANQNPRRNRRPAQAKPSAVGILRAEGDGPGLAHLYKTHHSAPQGQDWLANGIRIGASVVRTILAAHNQSYARIRRIRQFSALFVFETIKSQP